MAEIKWDIKRGADIYRQVSADRLKSWISSGKIKPDEAVVWRSGFSGWRRPEELEELIPYFRHYEIGEERKIEERKIEERKIEERKLVRKSLPEKTWIKNILIIDDEKDLCQLLGDILSSHGYNVECANTNREAISSLNRHSPDLVFLDLKLPDGDGLKLLYSIKKINPSITVNIISAYGTEEVRDEARKLGTYGFIDKPFSEEAILSIIREVREVGAS
ncbi:MAG: response regulator [Desulfobacteraceae bacterium]|nr:response regulator [Desulfobacteraceae bacterium]